jgi:hypothetical protein
MCTSTLSYVQVTVHFYNSNSRFIGDANGYTCPSNLDAGHTGTFDVSTDQINGLSAIFRLSYDWANGNLNIASLSRLPVGELLGAIAMVLLTRISASVLFLRNSNSMSDAFYDKRLYLV